MHNAKILHAVTLTPSLTHIIHPSDFILPKKERVPSVHLAFLHSSLSLSIFLSDFFHSLLQLKRMKNLEESRCERIEEGRDYTYCGMMSRSIEWKK